MDILLVELNLQIIIELLKFFLSSHSLSNVQETAISVFYPREDMIDQGYTTFGYMKMQMVVTHGGRCAERLVFGDDITDGGSDDLEKITKVISLLCFCAGLFMCLMTCQLIYTMDDWLKCVRFKYYPKKRIKVY